MLFSPVSPGNAAEDAQVVQQGAGSRKSAPQPHLPWWRSVHPESVWPSASSRWTGPGASGPARPGEPAPAPVAEDRSGSASCRTPRSDCTRAPTLPNDKNTEITEIRRSCLLITTFAFHQWVHLSKIGQNSISVTAPKQTHMDRTYLPWVLCGSGDA